MAFNSTPIADYLSKVILANIEEIFPCEDLSAQAKQSLGIIKTALYGLERAGKLTALHLEQHPGEPRRKVAKKGKEKPVADEPKKRSENPKDKKVVTFGDEELWTKKILVVFYPKAAIIDKTDANSIQISAEAAVDGSAKHLMNDAKVVIWVSNGKRPELIVNAIKKLPANHKEVVAPQSASEEFRNAIQEAQLPFSLHGGKIKEHVEARCNEINETL